MPPVLPPTPSTNDVSQLLDRIMPPSDALRQNPEFPHVPAALLPTAPWTCRVSGEQYSSVVPPRFAIDDGAQPSGASLSYVSYQRRAWILSAANRVVLPTGAIGINFREYRNSDGTTVQLRECEYRERVIPCPSCGVEHPRESYVVPHAIEGHTPTTALCPACVQSYYRRCDTCGMHYHPVAQRETSCPACTRFHIHGSKRKPSPTFFGTDARNTFFGAEIELEFNAHSDDGYVPCRDCDGDGWRQARDDEDGDEDGQIQCTTCDGEGRVRATGTTSLRSIARDVITTTPAGFMHAERDGSLNNGIEFVTMPFSIGWMRGNTAIFTALYAAASTHCDHEHTANNAGQHVHMSRSGLTGRTESRMELLATSVRFRKFLLDLTLRRPDRLQQWASTNRDENLVTALRDGRHSPGLANRYRFLNWTRQTVECRGFAGKCDHVQLFCAVQFMDSLREFCEHATFAVELEPYLAFVAANQSKYPELHARIATINTSTEKPAQLPGEFSHRGRRFAPNWLKLPEVKGVEYLDRGAYREWMRSKYEAAHQPVRLDFVGTTIDLAGSSNNGLSNGDSRDLIAGTTTKVDRIITASDLPGLFHGCNYVYASPVMFVQLAALHAAGVCVADDA